MSNPETLNDATQRVENAMRRQAVDRVPALPKIWAAGACHLLGRNEQDICGDPFAVMETVVDAAIASRADAARVFLFPRRATQRIDGALCEVDEAGHPIGTIDMDGGWATLLAPSRSFDVTDPAAMAFNHYYPAHKTPWLETEEDSHSIAVPTADFYEEYGFGEMVERLKSRQGREICLIGDCDTPSLAFFATLRGVQEVMIDLIEEPELVEATFAKGLDIAVERARFWLRHGVRVLRLNDSMANMSVISPTHWREYIKPVFREFCSRVHAIDRDALIYCHICGNVMPILEDLVETGLDCIGPLDPLGGFTVGQVREQVAGRTSLMGGVNTLTLLKGTPEDVRAESLRCLDEMKGEPGYIIGSGCVVPPKASLENIRAMADATR